MLSGGKGRETSSTGVDDSPEEGRRGTERDAGSPEPGRRGPTPSTGGVGVGPKSDAVPEALRNAFDGVSGEAAPYLDSYLKHNRNSSGELSSTDSHVQLDPVRSTRCGKYTLLRTRVVDGEWFYDWLRLPCKGWHCPCCGPAKAARVRRAIAVKARELRLDRFLTLTLDPARVPDGADPVQYLRGKVWAKFRTYLKRKYGRSIQYIAVLEFTKAGVPHLHILIDRYIPQAWISTCWDALGAGKIVFIERVYDLNRVAHYLSKYLTKQVLLSAPRGVRRWTVSRGIKLFQRQKPTGEWSFLKQQFDSLYMLAAAQFLLSVERSSDGEIKSFSTYQNVAAF